MAPCDRSARHNMVGETETARSYLPISGPAILLFLAFLALPLSGWSVAAQATGEAEGEPAGEAAHDEEGGRDLEYRHVIGLFLGFTDEEDSDPQFTRGLEYSFRVNPHWSVGALVEYAGGDMRNRVLAVPFSWFPHAGWYFRVSPGLEYHNGRGTTPDGEDEDEKNILLKIGGGYEFELGKHFILAPSYALDFVDGEQVSVYGVNFAVQF